MAEEQRVWLEGGTVRGQVATVPLDQPRVLEFDDEDGGKRTEEYVHVPGRTHDHDMYGELPVMAYRDEDGKVFDPADEA